MHYYYHYLEGCSSEYLNLTCAPLSFLYHPNYQLNANFRSSIKLLFGRFPNWIYSKREEEKRSKLSFYTSNNCTRACASNFHSEVSDEIVHCNFV